MIMLEADANGVEGAVAPGSLTTLAVAPAPEPFVLALPIEGMTPAIECAPAAALYCRATAEGLNDVRSILPFLQAATRFRRRLYTPDQNSSTGPVAVVAAVLQTGAVAAPQP